MLLKNQIPSRFQRKPGCAQEINPKRGEVGGSKQMSSPPGSKSESQADPIKLARELGPQQGWPCYTPQEVNPKSSCSRSESQAASGAHTQSPSGAFAAFPSVVQTATDAWPSTYRACEGSPTNGSSSQLDGV